MRCACTPASLELDASRIAWTGRPEENTTLLHPTHAEVQEARAFKHALVLDPWTEPIESRGKAQKLTRPLFCINSEAFTVWHKNFDPLRSLLEEAAQNNRSREGWLLTLSKTRHTDFSDYPYVLKTMFGSEVSAKECTRVFAGATVLQIAARASSAWAEGRRIGPPGGEQAREGNGGKGPTSVDKDVIAASIAALSNGSAAGEEQVHPASADDGPHASFWTGVDAMMNANGNGDYGARDKEKSKYPGNFQPSRLRIEWEGETDQTRLGRPHPKRDDEADGAAKAKANGHAKATSSATMGSKRKKGRKEEPEYGKERLGILVVHPLGTPASCPSRLVGGDSNNHKTTGPRPNGGAAVANAAPIRKLSNSLRGASLVTLNSERQLSQDDRTPRRKNSRLEP